MWSQLLARVADGPRKLAAVLKQFVVETVRAGGWGMQDSVVFVATADNACVKAVEG